MRFARVAELKIEDNNFSADALAQFFQGLRSLEDAIPVRIAVGFKSDDGPDPELAEHSCASVIGELIEHNAEVEELRISGSVTVIDVQVMLEGLGKNSHLKKFQVESAFASKYASPDPDIPPKVQEEFDKLVRHLSAVLSKSKLQILKYPLLTEIFMYSTTVLNNWPDCEAKMEQNRKPARTGRGHR
jgi:hypothetical protein